MTDSAQRVRHFYTKVVGVTRRNRDGFGRQGIIRDECEPLLPVELRHEPDNRYDPNAVAVLLRSGDQIGYLERRLAGETVRRQEAGYRQTAFITAVTGGKEYFDDEDRVRHTKSGVNLVIILADGEASEQDVRDYCSSVVVPELAKDPEVAWALGRFTHALGIGVVTSPEPEGTAAGRLAELDSAGDPGAGPVPEFGRTELWICCGAVVVIGGALVLYFITH